MKIENFTELQAMRETAFRLSEFWENLNEIVPIDDEDEISLDTIDKHINIAIENRMRLIANAEKELLNTNNLKLSKNGN